MIFEPKDDGTYVVELWESSGKNVVALLAEVGDLHREGYLSGRPEGMAGRCDQVAAGRARHRGRITRVIEDV
jgi:hypothetical protein